MTLRRHRRALPPRGGGAEIDEELRHHLEESVDRLVREGWDEREAREEATRRMGDLGRWRSETLATHDDRVRRKRMMNGMDSLVQDVRFALRALRNNPGFAWTFVATLALGIGATGAIFSVVDAVMLRPLPFEEPDRLVEAHLDAGGGFNVDLRANQVAPWTEGADFLQTVAAHTRLAMVHDRDGEPVSVLATAASHTIDEVLGVSAWRGRLFAEDDAEPGARTVILSWSYWSELGGDPGIVGRSIQLDGEPWTVIGILPRGVKYPVAGRVQLWIPLASDQTAGGLASDRLSVVGRLADGITMEMALERTRVLGAALDEADPLPDDWSFNLTPATRWRVNADARLGLLMVSSAVGLMFLIAIVNAVNLLLVRAHDRAAEVSIRKALGASRRRVIGQVVAESLVLSLVGGALASGVAALCVEAVAAIAPDELTLGMAYDFGLDARALLVIFTAAVAAGLLVAPLPALGAATVGIRGGGAARERGRDRAGRRVRGALVATQIALSVVLLTGAGLFLRSFAIMTGQDVGMDADQIAIATVSLPDARYSDVGARVEFSQRMLERLRALPGVEAVVLAQGTPPDGGGIMFAPALQGEGLEPIEEPVYLPMAFAPEGYFETLGTRIVGGRAFQAEDVGAHVAIVDLDFARTVFGREDVVGQRLRTDDEDEWLTIVGVVEELQLSGLEDRLSDMAILLPLDPDEPPQFIEFVVRSPDPRSLLQEMRAVVHAIDDQLPLHFLGTGEDALGEDAHRPRFLVVLMSVLAALAVTLAAIGVYGVVSFVVRKQQRDVGIRLALGAPRRRVGTEIFAWGLKLGAAGLVAGLVVAARLDDLVSTLLYGVEPGDALTRGTVVVAILAVVSAACLLPARRAARADPVEVLRADG